MTNLPPERLVGLAEAFDKFLEEDREEGPYRAPGLHASEISHCQRLPVYTLLDTQKKGVVPLIWRKRFMVGTALHDMIQKKLRRMADASGGLITFESEVPLAPGLQPLSTKWNIHSSCDGVLTYFEKHSHNGRVWHEPLTKVVVEIKSKAPDPFEKMTKPERDHVEQAHVYMAALDISWAWTLYFNKGNQNMTPSRAPYLFPFDPELWRVLENRFGVLHEKAERKELPDRTTGIWCVWCPYAWTCEPPGHFKAEAKPPIPMRRPHVR